MSVSRLPSAIGSHSGPHGCIRLLASAIEPHSFIAVKPPFQLPAAAVRLPVETLGRGDVHLWRGADCPQCRTGQRLEDPRDSPQISREAQ